MITTAADLPAGRSLTDDELAIYVAQAILHPQISADLPLQVAEFLPRLLGTKEGGPRETRAFRAANPELDFRIAQFCWRLVILGYLVPRTTGEWGSFQPTERGREFLDTFDTALITQGGLDGRLRELGIDADDPVRLYARLAHDCFLASFHEAFVVMLGVASESKLRELAAALDGKIQGMATAASRRPTPSTANQDLTWLMETLNTHRRSIRAALEAADRESGWLSELPKVLAGTGNAIRLSRNELGHPTGIEASQDDALPLITLFPRFVSMSDAAVRALSGV